MKTPLECTNTILAFALGMAMSLTAVAEPPDDKPAALENEELRDAAARAYESAEIAFKNRMETAESLFRWSRIWMEAECAASKTQEQSIQAVRSHLSRLQALGRHFVTYPVEIAEVDYYLTEVEILLAKVDSKEKERIQRSMEDRRWLQGEWKTVAETRHGKPIKAADYVFDTITVRGRMLKEKKVSGESWGLLSLDPTASPKTFRCEGRNDDYIFRLSGSYRLVSDVWTMTLPDDVVITLVRAKTESNGSGRSGVQQSDMTTTPPSPPRR